MNYLSLKHVLIDPIVLGLIIGLLTISVFGLIVSALGHWALTVKLVILSLFWLQLDQLSQAFPAFAEELFQAPIDKTGKIVCSACHLAELPIRISSPSSVFPASYFDLIIEIPTSRDLMQVSSIGDRVSLNVGGIIVLPEDFTLVQVTDHSILRPWHTTETTALVYGPINAQEFSTLALTIMAPENGVPMKYSIIVGGNRGRGQLYPSGTTTNNSSFRSPIKGLLWRIHCTNTITAAVVGGLIPVLYYLPIGLALTSLPTLVGMRLKTDLLIVPNLNIGGLGQTEVAIVLQEPARLWLYNQ